MLTLKVPNKIVADDVLKFLHYFLEKIRLGISCCFADDSHDKKIIVLSASVEISTLNVNMNQKSAFWKQITSHDDI